MTPFPMASAQQKRIFWDACVPWYSALLVLSIPFLFDLYFIFNYFWGELLAASWGRYSLGLAVLLPWKQNFFDHAATPSSFLIV